MRTNRNKALRAGLQFRKFDPMECLDQVLEINRSSNMRQNRRMDPDYLDAEALSNFFEPKRDQCYGVFERDGRLRAYCYAPVFGELCIFAMLLGHANFLKDGIMFLLLSETIREIAERPGRSDRPRWIMYDTFLGASEGIRYFKQRLGFAPFRVRWQLGIRPESKVDADYAGGILEESLHK